MPLLLSRLFTGHDLWKGRSFLRLKVQKADSLLPRTPAEDSSRMETFLKRDPAEDSTKFEAFLRNALMERVA